MNGVPASAGMTTLRGAISLRLPSSVFRLPSSVFCLLSIDLLLRVPGHQLQMGGHMGPPLPGFSCRKNRPRLGRHVLD